MTPDRRTAKGALPRESDLARAREVLSAYQPRDVQQVETRERMLAFIAAHSDDAHLRTCLQGHLTAGVLLLDHAGERALLTLHRKLGRWLQLGGHCDGDANLAGVALREATEESGIEGIEIELEPFDLDIHTIPARQGEPAHEHLDVRFVARAPRGARPMVSDESLALRWVAPHELDELDVDASVRRLFDLILGGARPASS